MATSRLSEGRIQDHKAVNTRHTVLLIVGMLMLLGGLGYLLGGLKGVFWAVGIGAAFFAFSPSLSPQLILRMYRARPLTLHEAPRLHEIMQILSRRAELRVAPRLYYIPSQMMNAFTVGRRDEAVIGVTDGLLRRLNLRELTGVLAHEISHVRNDDMKVMNLADVVSRVTSLFSTFGQILLLVNLPLLLMGEIVVSWFVILLLIIAPTLSALLQLALSRTREFDADLEAARLTGDPEGLALALQKLEHYHTSIIERILMPGRRVPDPSLFRSHPHTLERVEQLIDLREHQYPEPVGVPGTQYLFPSRVPPISQLPRWRVLGFWY